MKIVIRADSDRTFWSDLSEMWAYRGMFIALVEKEVTIRYKQAAIGIAWVILQPLMTTAIFSIIFGVFAKFPSGDVPYPVFVFSGLLTWTFISRVLNEGTSSLVRNAPLITKIYFPRMLFPLSTLASALIDFVIALGILLIVMLLFGVAWRPTMIFLPVGLFMAAAFSFSVSLTLAPLNALYRDIGHAMPFFVQILMFLCPVIYPTSFVPEAYRFLMDFNPIATIIDFVRWSLIGGAFPSAVALISLVVITATLLVFGMRVFRSLEPRFVDNI